VWGVDNLKHDVLRLQPAGLTFYCHHIPETQTPKSAIIYHITGFNMTGTEPTLHGKYTILLAEYGLATLTAEF